MTWTSSLGQDDTERVAGRGGGFDPSRPHPARVYHHWIGGKDTFGPDRAVAAKVAEIAPWVVAGARGNRAFLTRVVTHLARAGISQFVDVGSGLDDDPAGVVAAFREALAPGSCIAISHVADLPDGDGPARAAATREAVGVYEELAAPFVLRTCEQVTGLFTGLRLVDPGVVPVQLWRPARGRPGPAVPVLGGVGLVTAPVPGTAQAAQPSGEPPETHSGGSAVGILVAGNPASPDLDALSGQQLPPAPEPDLRRSPDHGGVSDGPGGRS